jgi:hypothetical protein
MLTTTSTVILSTSHEKPLLEGTFDASLLSLCLCALPLGGRLQAQFEYGEILGTVRDSSGGVVPRAKITLRSSDTNVESVLLTNEQGNYSFPDLRAGNYVVSVAAEGFRPIQSSALVLRVGDRLRIDLALETGQITEQVTVAAEATPLLETDTIIAPAVR